MRRSEIRESINQILKALDESGLSKILNTKSERDARERREEQTKPATLLNALKEYIILESRFSPVTRRIAEILQLNQICDADLWPHLFQNDENKTSAVKRHLSTSYRQAKEIIPQLVALLDQKDTDDYTNAFKDNIETNQYSKLTVIILEDDLQFSRPERLIEVLTGFVDLYKACARLEHVSTNDLTVLSCDSGSDKSFDFLGLAKVMEQVKEIFMGLWDRVVFYKEKRLSSQIEVIAQGLPVLAKITDLESTNHISPEEAEIVRRGIIKGCGKILNAGAIIPEINEHATYNPRVLMAPEQKLLMPPPNPKSKDEEAVAKMIPSDIKPAEEKTDERIQQIEKMLADLKNDKKLKSKPRDETAPSDIE